MSATLHSIASNQSPELQCYTMDFAPDDAGNTPSSRLPVAATYTLQPADTAIIVCSLCILILRLCRIVIQWNLFVLLFESEQANCMQGLRILGINRKTPPTKRNPLCYCIIFYPYTHIGINIVLISYSSHVTSNDEVLQYPRATPRHLS
jgi:hypothetical protein